MTSNELVLGNPGTGKTYNLVQRIKEKIKKGYKPEDVTVLSHTRVAANEIASRSGIGGIQASTIHSLAYRIAEVSRGSVIGNREIKEFSEGIGIPMKGSSGRSDEFLEMGDEYIAIVNLAEASCQPYEWAYNLKGRPGVYADFKYFYANYNEWKKIYGFIDFGEMLTQAINNENSLVLPVLLVDEAQDLSKRQWQLIYKISKNTKEMVVTGDPDQALFSWGGAHPHGMIEWGKEVNAKVTELDQSYRLPRVPYKLSKEIISKVKNRYEKDFKPLDKEGSVERYSSIQHIDFTKVESALILYRAHVMRKDVEDELIAATVPYTVLNGMRGWCHNKFGVGVKAWMSIKKEMAAGGTPCAKDISKVKSVASPLLVRAIDNNDLELMDRLIGPQALDIPSRLYHYYSYVDFSKEGNILLSTIHGAKGMEHDNVILINTMTQRILEEAMANPDPEYQVWYVAITRTKDNLIIVDGDGAYNPL